MSETLIFDYYENNAETFSADEIIDKTLYAKYPITSYTLPQTSAPVHQKYKAGDMIGIVNSYIQKGNDLFWQFTPPGRSMPYYVKHSAGAFSTTSLKDQGAMTEKEKAKAKEKQNETVADVLKGSTITFINSAKWVLIIALFILIGFFVYKQTRK